MQNRITSLKNVEGHTLESYKDMETELVSYFEDILTKDVQDKAQAIQ